MAAARKRLHEISSLCAILLLCAIPAAHADEIVGTVRADEIHSLVQAEAGKVVVVNFWATWCPPCLKEFPDIVRTFNEYHTGGLEVLAVSMNAADEMADIEEFLGTYEPPFPVYQAASADEAFYQGVVRPWFGEIPITLVYDAAGELAHYHRQQVTYEQLAREVAELLP